MRENWCVSEILNLISLTDFQTYFITLSIKCFKSFNGVQRKHKLHIWKLCVCVCVGLKELFKRKHSHFKKSSEQFVSYLNISIIYIKINSTEIKVLEIISKKENQLKKYKQFNSFPDLKRAWAFEKFISAKLFSGVTSSYI